MDMDKIKSFIELAKSSGLAELSYEGKDEKIKVRLPYATDAVMSAPMPLASAQASGSAAPAASATTQKDSGLIDVVSPFVGTFYRSPSPDSDSYVEIGTRVSTGQVLCIVEAMKIMNEIESDVQGEIVEICVENETYVEYGQVLFRLKK